jgi:hypothetical protein
MWSSGFVKRRITIYGPEVVPCTCQCVLLIRDELRFQSTLPMRQFFQGTMPSGRRSRTVGHVAILTLAWHNLAARPPKLMYSWAPFPPPLQYPDFSRRWMSGYTEPICRL